MPLTPGTRLGGYEVIGLIGVGGMGEVYRARDTKLGREVALKILPDAFATDVDRLARFQREAKMLASLNHPNIGAIYGLEEANGVTALVMELVEGEDLAQRIARGPIQLDEALPIAKQIAEALEAAHERGIIHRDLKPANIKVRPDGTVKVLDFGLAKAMEPSDGPSNVSQSPTITTPAMTQAGVILGTAAYMSPEQARGRPADKRSDIWAFGATLYEMLTGERAFHGEDVSDTLACVLRGEPDWSALPAATPPVVKRLLRRCLEKDRTRRLHDIGDARLDLEEPLTHNLDEIGSPGSPPRVAWRWAAAWAASLLVATVLVAIATRNLMRPADTASLGVLRLAVNLPADVAYGAADLAGGFELALSPDGTRLVFSAIKGGQQMLYMRDLHQVDALPIRGTEGGKLPFFSPDGEWLAFSHEPIPSSRSLRRLKKVAIRGGPPVTITDSPYPGGGSWGTDNTIIFPKTAAGGNRAVLMRVSAAGGEPTALTALDPKRNEQAHTWPEFLPGNNAVLFSVRTGPTYDQGAHVAVLSLATGASHTVIEQGYHARYLPSGHIVYALGGTLMAVPFDLERLQTTGPPVPVGEGIRGRAGQVGEADFAVSRTGFLAYSPGPLALAGPTSSRTLAWVKRDGTEELLSAPPKSYTYVRLSTDETKVALDVREQDGDIWVWHLVRQTLTRVTANPDLDLGPVWTVEGTRLVFGSTRGSTQNLAWQAADGTGAREWLAESANQQVPTAVSPDGKYVVFSERTGPTNLMNLRLLSLADRLIVPLLETPRNTLNGEISPNGHWLAYESDESGQPEVYVRPFPDVNRSRSQVSTNGGTRPQWNRNGRELFYLGGPQQRPSQMMAVPVQTGANFSADHPRHLFEWSYFAGVSGRTYDVSSDGQRFLMIKEQALADEKPGPSPLIVVLNWTEELKRLVPTK